MLIALYMEAHCCAQVRVGLLVGYSLEVLPHAQLHWSSAPHNWGCLRWSRIPTLKFNHVHVAILTIVLQGAVLSSDNIVFDLHFVSLIRTIYRWSYPCEMLSGLLSR